MYSAGWIPSPGDRSDHSYACEYIVLRATQQARSSYSCVFGQTLVHMVSLMTLPFPPYPPRSRLQPQVFAQHCEFHDPSFSDFGHEGGSSSARNTDVSDDAPLNACHPLHSPCRSARGGASPGLLSRTARVGDTQVLSDQVGNRNTNLIRWLVLVQHDPHPSFKCRVSHALAFLSFRAAPRLAAPPAASSLPATR